MMVRHIWRACTTWLTRSGLISHTTTSTVIIPAAARASSESLPKASLRHEEGAEEHSLRYGNALRLISAARSRLSSGSAFLKGLLAGLRRGGTAGHAKKGEKPRKLDRSLANFICIALARGTCSISKMMPSRSGMTLASIISFCLVEADPASSTMARSCGSVWLTSDLASKAESGQPPIGVRGHGGMRWCALRLTVRAVLHKVHAETRRWSSPALEVRKVGT